MAQTKIEYVGLGNITNCSSSGNTLFGGGTGSSGTHSSYCRFGMTHIYSKIGSSYIQLKISGTAPTIKLHVYVAAVFRITYSTSMGSTTSPFRILIHAEVPAGSTGTINAPIYNPGGNKSPIWGAFYRSFSSGSGSQSYNYTSMTIQEITTTPNIYIISDSADSNLVYDNLYNEQPWTFVDTVNNILTGAYSNSNGIFSKNGNVYYSPIYSNNDPSVAIVPVLCPLNSNYLERASMIGGLNDTDGADVKGVVIKDLYSGQPGLAQVYPPITTLEFSNMQVGGSTVVYKNIRISFNNSTGASNVLSNSQGVVDDARIKSVLIRTKPTQLEDNPYITLTVSRGTTDRDLYVWVSGNLEGKVGTVNLLDNTIRFSFAVKIPSGSTGNVQLPIRGTIYAGGPAGSGMSNGNLINASISSSHIAIIQTMSEYALVNNGGHWDILPSTFSTIISGISTINNTTLYPKYRLGTNWYWCDNCSHAQDNSGTCSVCGSQTREVEKGYHYHGLSSAGDYLVQNNRDTITFTPYVGQYHPKYLHYSTHSGGNIESIPGAIKLIYASGSYNTAGYSSYLSANIDTIKISHKPTNIASPVQKTCLWSNSTLSLVPGYNDAITKIPDEGFTYTSTSANPTMVQFSSYAFAGYFSASRMVDTATAIHGLGIPFDFNPTTYITRYFFNFKTSAGGKTRWITKRTATAFAWDSFSSSTSFTVTTPNRQSSTFKYGTFFTVSSLGNAKISVGKAVIGNIDITKNLSRTGNDPTSGSQGANTTYTFFYWGPGNVDAPTYCMMNIWNCPNHTTPSKLANGLVKTPGYSTNTISITLTAANLSYIYQCYYPYFCIYTRKDRSSEAGISGGGHGEPEWIFNNNFNNTYQTRTIPTPTSESSTLSFNVIGEVIFDENSKFTGCLVNFGNITVGAHATQYQYQVVYQ